MGHFDIDGTGNGLPSFRDERSTASAHRRALFPIIVLMHVAENGTLASLELTLPSKEHVGQLHNSSGSAPQDETKWNMA